MNNNIYRTEAKSLLITGCGSAEGGQIIPVATDSQGRMVLSPKITINAQASKLDIRSLTGARDSVYIENGSIDVRGLSGARDGIKLWAQSSAAAEQSANLGILTTVYILATDLSKYRENAFIIYNSSGISVGVNVTLQLAPENIANYYTDDGSSFSLLGGNTLVLIPSKVTKYARIQVSSLLSIASVTAFYFGRT